MTSALPVTVTSSQPARNLPRSAGAVFVGFISVVILSLGTDQILHTLNVYPPWGVAMYETHLNLLALSYRTIYTILAGYLTARLAPRAPMRHVLVLGIIGTIAGAAGAIGAMQLALGPNWYPISLAVGAFPSTWLGGLFHREKGDER